MFIANSCQNTVVKYVESESRKKGLKLNIWKSVIYTIYNVMILVWLCLKPLKHT